VLLNQIRITSLNVFMILLLLPMVTHAQEVDGFSYEPADISSLPEFLDIITQKKIVQYQGNFKKETVEFWEERRSDVLENIEDSLYIFDPGVELGLKKILTNIYTANPEVNPLDFRFFIDASPIPNASCYGNGIFVINNGLFSIIDNDDELAFIICHEIAHYQLKHNDLSIEEYYQKYKSDNTNKRVNDIAKNKYGKFNKARKLLEDINYDLGQKSRKAEIEADSLGLQLFLKTNYNPSAAGSILQKLDFEEKAMLNKPIAIKAYLGTVNYPFKDNWLKAGNNKLFDLDASANDYKMDADSIKTHPDIPKRIELINKSLPNATDEIGMLVANDLKKKSNLNNLQITLDNYRLDLSLYFIITLYEEQKINEAEFYQLTALWLKKLYILKKSHAVGRFIPPESPFSNETEINKVKQFIQNLEPKNIRKLGYWLCNENVGHFSTEAKQIELYSFFKKLNPSNK